MTRIIGSLLGVSFQTELLIMALLGLANSTLDWKPLELNNRLNQIRELDIVSEYDVRLSQNFTLFIKKLLSVTVIVEFFCGLINPFAYLLNLYPIITWSHSNILLPWLATHAINTVVPKILSVVLVFVFYSEHIISTRSLLEFLIVETINFLIACYNWYVFFIFHLDLREVDRSRELCKNQEKQMEIYDSSSETYSSIPNIQELFRETMENYDEFKDLRAVKSLTSLVEIDSQDIILDDDANSILSVDKDLSLAEKTMKILHVTKEELEDVRKHKRDADATNNLDDEPNAEYTDQDADYTSANEQFVTVAKSDLIEHMVKDSCTCSSSDDDSDMISLASKKIPTLHSKRNRKSRKSSKSTQIIEHLHNPSLDAVLFSPTTTMILNHRIDQLNDDNDKLNFLLNRNFELLDKMCRAVNFKSQTIPKNSKQKWLIFRHEFESSLDKNMFSKESTSKTSMSKKKIGRHQYLMAHSNQKENKLKCEDKNKEKHKILFNPSKIMEFNRNSAENIMESNVNVFKFFPLSHTTNEKIISRDNKINIESSVDFKLPGISNFNIISKSKKSNASISNSRRPLLQSDYMESDKIKELRNLQAYNNLTLEQDRREMLQKKKKSKMSSYKNAANELALHNSDVVMSNAEAKVFSRTCKSNQSRKRIDANSNYPSNVRERKGRNIKQFYKYSEFLYNENNNKTSEADIPLGVNDKTSACAEDVNKGTKSFFVEKELNIFDDKALEDASSSSNTKNKDLSNIEVDSTCSEKESESSISTEVPQSNCNTLPDQNRRSSIREIIEGIDWNTHSRNTSDYVPNTESVNTKSHFVDRTEEEAPARLGIVDDETVSMLQSAFSFSDESVRGFHLGPESNEPYPIFQVVTLTIAEIFKATGWRNFADLLSTQSENEIEIPFTEDCIFCGGEVQHVDNTNSEDFNAFVEVPKELNVETPDEIMQRKMLSAHLLEQLQELLESARGTLSAVETFRSANPDESQLKPADDSKELFPNSTFEYVTVFKDLYNHGEKMKSNIKTLETYICTINETNSSGDDTPCGDDVNSNLPRKRSANPISQTNLSRRNEDTNLNFITAKEETSREEEKNCEVSSGTKQTAEKRKSQKYRDEVCATKFENRVQVHQRKQGEGLSSGNIMEYDSEGHIITPFTTINTSFNSTEQKEDKSQDSLISNSEKDVKSLKHENFNTNVDNNTDNNTDNNLVELFESFYRKMSKELENTKNNSNPKLEQELKKLAKTQNFSKFMSLFNDEDNKDAVTKPAMHINSNQSSLNKSDINTNSLLNLPTTELELKSSDYQSNDDDIQKAFTQEQDSHTPVGTEGTNIDNTTSKLHTKTNRNTRTSYSHELHKNHRQYLNSDAIKQTIKNWNRDSEESLDIIGINKKSKYVDNTISFSDNSDMEEF